MTVDDDDDDDDAGDATATATATLATAGIDAHYPADGEPWVVVHPMHENVTAQAHLPPPPHHDDDDEHRLPPAAAAAVEVPVGYVRVTYKDMLLKRPAAADESVAAAAAATAAEAMVVLRPAAPWRPRIEVQDVAWKRVDREYGMPARDPLYYDESDDYGIEDVIAGELGMKQHASVSRVRSVSMLPLKTLEKKMSRIADKAGPTTAPTTAPTASS